MRGDERREIDALGRFWDQVPWAGGAEPAAHDPLLSRAIDRLHALDAQDTVPAPDVAFVRSLEEDLMRVHHGAAAAPMPSFRTVPSDGVRTLPPAGLRADPVGRRPVRFPFAQLLSAAAVLLTLSSAVFAYRLLPRDGGRAPAPPAVQPEWARPEPEVPAASACRVDPSPPERVRLTGTPGSPAALPVIEDRSFPGELPVVELADLPVGRAAEERAADGVAATLTELVACFNGGDEARQIALFSDDYWRRANARGGPIGGDGVVGPNVVFLAPGVDRDSGEAASPALASVHSLGDGRVGALVVPQGALRDDDRDFANALYLVLAERDDRWLIDEAARVNAITTVIETAEYPFAGGEGNGTPDGETAREATFRPTGIETGVEAPLLLVIHNCEPEPLAFAIEEIGVRVDVAPGQFAPVVVAAPPGSYRYTGSLAGRTSLGLTGRLVLHPSGTPAPATPVTAASQSVTIESFDFGFAPDIVAVPADTEVVNTIESTGVADHTFTIDALGIDLPVGAGDTSDFTIVATAGEYTFSSSGPGHRAAGMTGTLVVRVGTGGTPASPAAATPLAHTG